MIIYANYTGQNYIGHNYIGHIYAANTPPQARAGAAGGAAWHAGRGVGGQTGDAAAADVAVAARVVRRRHAGRARTPLRAPQGADA